MRRSHSRPPPGFASTRVLLVGALLVGPLASSCGTGDRASPPSHTGIGFEQIPGDSAFDYAGSTWGLAVGDFDNDGWMDLYSSNHGGGAKVFRNLGERFADVTALVMEVSRGDSHGAAWADFDNDGDQDLLQLVGAGRGQGHGSNRLMVNRRGRLEDEAVARGVDDPLGRGRTPLWLDWNGDGWLDALVNNAPREDASSRLLLGSAARFEPHEEPPWRHFNSQHAGLFLAGHDLAVLVVGQPTSQLIQLPSSTGTAWAGALEIPTPSDWGSADLDGDGDLDLILTRGSGAPSVQQTAPRQLRAHLPLKDDEKAIEFSSPGPVAFDLEPASKRWWQPQHVWIGSRGSHPAEMRFSLSGPGAAGHLAAPIKDSKSIEIAYHPGTGTWRVTARAKGREVLNLVVQSETPIVDIQAHGFTPGVSGGWVKYLSGPDVLDRTEQARLSTVRGCGSIATGDFDNDEDVDLYLVCSDSGLNRPNILLENSGGGSFAPVAEAGGAAGPHTGTGERVAVIDFDRDGFLDLVVANGGGLRPFNNGPLQLFRNRGGRNQWIEVELHGAQSNRDGIGARLHVETDRGRQTRLRGAGTHAGSQDQPTIHFGLYSAEAVSLTIEWPLGTTQRFSALPVDRVFHVHEPSADGRAIDAGGDGAPPLRHAR